MKRIQITSILVHALIIAFWLGILGACLFFSDIMKNFHQKPTLTIFSWGDIFDPMYLKKFEEETGIQVVMSYYSSNEELLVKLEAMRGKGYDLIVPSDYSVKELIARNLLQPLDKSKLNFLETLDPQLLNLPFDPHNHYSLPFAWEVFGLGIHRLYFTDSLQPSWDLIFKQPPYRIVMVNDPLAAVLFTTYYLYGFLKPLNESMKKRIVELLIQQKSWVEAYVDFRADYFLATHNCPVVVASSSYMIRSMREFDFIDFVIPAEGSFITIENIALPGASKNQEYAYKFLNFIYRTESIMHHFNKFGFFPPTPLNDLQILTNNSRLNALFTTIFQQFSHFYFFQKILPDQALRDLWISVKSA